MDNKDISVCIPEAKSFGSGRVCAQEFEAEARAKLGRAEWGYYSSGATAQTTVGENEDAFGR